MCVIFFHESKLYVVYSKDWSVMKLCRYFGGFLANQFWSSYDERKCALLCARLRNCFECFEFKWTNGVIWMYFDLMCVMEVILSRRISIPKMKIEKFSLENPGIDPGTSRMLSERSTMWANSPRCQVLCITITNPLRRLTRPCDAHETAFVYLHNFVSVIFPNKEIE